MKEFNHIDEKGNARMVDVSGKEIQKRFARASGKILLANETIELIKKNLNKKGDVLTVAKIAGIQAAKNTAQLIPLCHPLSLENAAVNFNFVDNGIEAAGEVKSIGRTGVEMEALIAVSIALLTIYDMCKAVDKTMQITDIVLLEKTKNNL